MDFFDAAAVRCEHSKQPDVPADVPLLIDFSPPADRSFADPSEPDVATAPALTLGVDLGSGSSPSYAGAPARRTSRIPPRIADRPRIEEWTDDELLTLPEAAALFWPAGPITTNTLRTAARDGTLVITKVAGKFFTTPMAIRRMGVAAEGKAPDQKRIVPESTSPRTLFEAKLEEAKRQARDRKSRQRAAKRSGALTEMGAGR